MHRCQYGVVVSHVVYNAVPAALSLPLLQLADAEAELMAECVAHSTAGEANTICRCLACGIFCQMMTNHHQAFQEPSLAHGWFFAPRLQPLHPGLGRVQRQTHDAGGM